MPELKKSTPRLEAKPMESNPKLSIGIGEKGGISVYGMARFPVTLYFEQWRTLLNDDTVAEIIAFGESHPDLLSERAFTTDEPTKSSANNLITLAPAEESIIDAEIAYQKGKGDVDKQVHYATLKALAAQNGGKLPVVKMVEIFNLKREQADRK